MANAKTALKHVDEMKILNVLSRYYSATSVTFEWAAHEAGITVYEMIEYAKRRKLPIIWTEEDRAEGVRKVSLLMKKLVQ